MDGLLGFCACVLGFFLLVGLGIGGWQAGWWFTEKNVDRQAVVNRDSYGFQQAHDDELQHEETDISKITVQIADPSISSDQRQALTAQRTAEITEACHVANQITHPTSSDSVWIAAHCGKN